MLDASENAFDSVVEDLAMSGALGKIYLRAFVGAWIVAVGAGVLVLADYSNRPGNISPAPVSWPDSSSFQPTEATTAVVVSIHPRCPCSRATLQELAELLGRADTRATILALFYKPVDEPDTWTHTDLWEAAGSIPGVVRVVDADGREAHRFGIQTSGETLVYARDRRLAFAGGITAGRGHLGENAGADAVAAILAGREPEIRHSAVYGCAIDDPVEDDRSSR